ncbi:hypothetical protein BJP40_06535 [Streptomyces sp. CC53]|uniref:hypothetical protein n=1 Tax=Streptomyces sp. CC53 TaxID=1906740 RepID=UPI0008DD3D23|nr:hypothetical protein [Streptomyces sp. CC53]OII61179.1 hypothetical protein BJP40_06535 [Streptomyces sp. CC53]
MSERSDRDKVYDALSELYVSHQRGAAPFWAKSPHNCTSCEARMAKVMAVVDEYAEEVAYQAVREYRGFA